VKSRLASTENKEKDRGRKGQLAVLSIFFLVYPHSQSFWNWYISHLLKIEEGGKALTLKRKLSVVFNKGEQKKKEEKIRSATVWLCAIPIVRVIE
jgi:hypothetical protein